MANGQPFNGDKPTIAHAYLPLGTKVLLESVADPSKRVEAIVTDRQAQWVREERPDRAVDATRVVAQALGFGEEFHKGLLLVRVRVLQYPPLKRKPQKG